jgi:hypothetical protein
MPKERQVVKIRTAISARFAMRTELILFIGFGQIGQWFLGEVCFGYGVWMRMVPNCQQKSLIAQNRLVIHIRGEWTFTERAVVAIRSAGHLES